MRRTGVRLSVPYMFQTLMRSFEIYGVYSKLVARRQQRSASYGENEDEDRQRLARYSFFAALDLLSAQKHQLARYFVEQTT